MEVMPGVELDLFVFVECLLGLQRKHSTSAGIIEDPPSLISLVLLVSMNETKYEGRQVHA